jgi:L-asparaginase II
VDEHSNVLFHMGDPDEIVYYRSSSKPIQALPVIARDLDYKYGITEEESVLFAGSHAGEPFHIEAMESIMKKAGFTEDMLVMNATIPGLQAPNEARVRAGLPPRKFYHNCSGKHAALMLVQRELGGNPRDYWKLDAVAQHEVKQTIAAISEVQQQEIVTGIDGCGVPVFAVGMRNIAIAYKNLACIDTIKDEKLQAAAKRYVPLINQYPHMMRGTGLMCTLINKDPNIVAKGGAAGVYGCGLKKERIGIAFKLADGVEYVWPLVLSSILRQIGYQDTKTLSMLDSLYSNKLYNDNKTEVGRSEIGFSIYIYILQASLFRIIEGI